MNPTTPHLRRAHSPAGIFLSLLLSALFPGTGLSGAEVFELSPEAIANLRLEYATVENRSLSPTVEATGAVKLAENKVIDIVPRIAGMIDKDHQLLGAVVKKGDPLFTLESAELATSLTAYVDAEQAMNFAHTALEQEKKLHDRNLSSKENLQARELDFQKALAEHTRALQPLKLLHFDEGTIHQYLHNVGAGNYTTLEITSPGDGEIIEKSVRLGASVAPDEKLYTIADLSDLWVDFHVSLRDAAVLTKGQGVGVESSVSRGQQGEATVTYVAPLADESTRTVLVRATLPNKDRQWRPGTPVMVSVTAALDSNANTAALTVPVSALVDYGGAKAVFLREGESSFRPVTVETGDSDGNVIRITAGLESGQTVVSTNAAQLKGHLEMTNQ